VRERLPPDARVGLNDTGAIAYFGERKTFDIVGLTTPSEARYWVGGAASRFEHYERLARDPATAGALPSHFAVYPEWLSCPPVLGERLFESTVRDASILGGVTTLVGTSTNLVVNSFVVDAGLPPLHMFQFTWVGLPVAVACIAVMALSSRLLPTNASSEAEARSNYFLEARVADGSPMIGRSIEDNRLRNLEGLFLLEIEREGRLISPVGPAELLHAGDILVFTGEVARVQALQRFAGLEVFGAGADALLKSNLVEVVLSPMILRAMASVVWKAVAFDGVTKG